MPSRTCRTGRPAPAIHGQHSGGSQPDFPRRLPPDRRGRERSDRPSIPASVREGRSHPARAAAPPQRHARRRLADRAALRPRGGCPRLSSCSRRLGPRI